MLTFSCHCERSEAIQFFTHFFWIASSLMLLAMTSAAQANDLPPECKLLPVHVPQADVSVDYQAGVDVKGRPVVPADLNAQPFAGLDRMVIPLSVDLAERMNSPAAGLDLKAELGTLEIYQTGRIVYNGQDWTSQVYVLCGQKPPEDAVPKEPDLQTPQEPLESQGIEVKPLEAVPPRE